MRSYLRVSTVVFAVLTAAQLIRLVLGWTVVVAGLNIPVWISGIAALIVGSMAAWGARTLIGTRAPAA